MIIPFTLMISLLFWIAAPVADAPDTAAEVTIIRLTERVLVADVTRFGINLSDDSHRYYSGSVLRKQRAVVNFEGSSYRQIYPAPFWDRDGAVISSKMPEPWARVFTGSSYLILSGPSQWTSGTLREIRASNRGQPGGSERHDLLLFDRPVTLAAGGGIMLEAIRLNEGYLGGVGLGGRDDYWMRNLFLRHGDPPPGSTGRVAGLLDGSAGPAHLRLATHHHHHGALNGTWRLRFQARAVGGKPTLNITPDVSAHGGHDGGEQNRWGESARLHPGPQWQKYDLLLAVAKVPEPESAAAAIHLTWLIEVEGGELLIDDIELELEGDRNPTAFRDDLIATIRKFNPGHLRYLQMGGNTLGNTLLPPLEAHAFTSRLDHLPGPLTAKNLTSFGLHQFYELCHYLGIDPWYSLPGTLKPEEISQFMEYLGGDDQTEFGRIRIRLGQKRPWTDVFERIHIEFGNEAWNSAPPYKAGGFNGPGYWRGLIDLARESPYYQPNLIFHAAGQADGVNLNREIMSQVPNADRFGLAPYLIPTLSNEEMKLLDDDDKFFRWAFARALQRSLDPDGTMFRNQQLARENGLELSIYEINHHTTGGDAPVEPRNRLATSLGGAINVINSMLLMQREQKVRCQTLFNLAQHSYKAPGTVRVRLWGAALSMRSGRERYRPIFLAGELANRVIAGNLVETVHTGARPLFAATGIFNPHGEEMTVTNLPLLWSYGFSDGELRGLIVINLDTASAHRIAIEPTSAITGGIRIQLLTADAITAGNEFEQPEPRVNIHQNIIDRLGPDSTLTVPPHSMMTLAWRQRH